MTNRPIPTIQFDPAWIVVRTKSGAEEEATRVLKHRGFAAFCPLETVLPSYKRRPVFQRYIFADIAGMDLAAVRDAPGVDVILRNMAGDVGILNAQLVADLHCRFHNAPVLAGELEKNTRVRVATGIFAGYEGLVSHSKDRRIQVLLDIAENSIQISLRDTDVESLD